MTNSHFTYMKESLLNIYADIEGTRCLGVTNLRNFRQAVHLDLLRMHLRETMKQFVEAAATGRLTPDILSVPDLITALASNPSTEGSIVHRDPSLVYKFGKVIPIRIDFERLKFGFVLEVPNLRLGDIFPFYQMHNTGFHVSATHPLRWSNTMLEGHFEVPLPSYVALAPSVLKKNEVD